MSTEMITVGDQRIRVAVREGDGTQPPLLLMNGLGVSLEGLAPFVDALDPGTGVIRFDVPGVGGSPTPSAPYRFWGVSRLVSKMLDVLGQPQVDVLGASWGGALAQQFAFQDRARCRRLVLVSTTSGTSRSLGIFTEMFSRKRYTTPTRAQGRPAHLWRCAASRRRRHRQAPAALKPDPRGHIFQQLPARLDEPPVRAADPPADAHPDRRRRPDHRARQREDPQQGAAQLQASRVPRRAPGNPHQRRRARADR